MQTAVTVFPAAELHFKLIPHNLHPVARFRDAAQLVFDQAGNGDNVILRKVGLQQVTQGADRHIPADDDAPFRKMADQRWFLVELILQFAK